MTTLLSIMAIPSKAQPLVNSEYENYLTHLVERHIHTLPRNSFNDRNLRCLAMNIYYESRGERFLGQLAVANVTMNRSTQTNKTICQVVYSPGQFSWTANRNRNPSGTEWQKALALAWLVINQRNIIVDVTNGSQYFHSGRRTPPEFRSFNRTVIIGNHRFYRQNVPVTEVAEAQ